MKTARRNLLIVRAGETSLHPSWLEGDTPRNFDLLVSYYGTEADKYRAGADHYHVMQGPRWPAHDAICREQSALIAQYDYVGFACDDLEASGKTWNRLFDLCAAYRLDLAQPAIDGHISHDITRPRRGCILRFTNFVEIMCPVFSQEALQTISYSFSKSISGWGLALGWWSHLRVSGRVAIIDSVRVRHSRKVGEGTLYSLLSTLGVNAGVERDSLRDEYNSHDHTPSERSRLMRRPHGALRKMLPWAYR